MLLKLHTYYDLQNMPLALDVYFEERKIYEQRSGLYHSLIVSFSFMSSIAVVFFVGHSTVKQKFGKYYWFTTPLFFMSLVTVGFLQLVI
jgi:hypothetical protein